MFLAILLLLLVCLKLSCCETKLWKDGVCLKMMTSQLVNPFGFNKKNRLNCDSNLAQVCGSFLAEEPGRISGFFGHGNFWVDLAATFFCRKVRVVCVFWRLKCVVDVDDLPYKSWLTLTENGFMEPKYYAFRFGDEGHPKHQLRIWRLMPRGVSWWQLKDFLEFSPQNLGEMIQFTVSNMFSR